MTDTPTITLSRRVLAYVRRHPGCTAQEVTEVIGDPRVCDTMSIMRRRGVLAATGARGSYRYSVAREPRPYRRGSTRVRGGARTLGAAEGLRAELAEVEARIAAYGPLQERRDALRAAIELLGGGAA